ncbi:MAG: hypothetical protein ACE5K4_06150 [Candidatus Hydrothermarchaeota archaeon]
MVNRDVLKKTSIIILIGLIAFPPAYYTGEKFSDPPFNDGESILVKGKIIGEGKMSLGHDGIFEIENIQDYPSNIVVRGKYLNGRIYVEEFHKLTTLEKLGLSFDFFGRLTIIFSFLIFVSSLIKRR